MEIGILENNQEYFKNDVIYDLETFPTIFTFAAIFANGKGERVYEISSRKDDTEPMLEFMRNIVKNKFRMVGFNNLGFDYPVLHFILEKAREAKASDKPLKLTAKMIYAHVEKMFQQSKDSRFGNAVKNSDVILPQVDLFKIHHFDNKARSTSLKMLEFNMRSDEIEDLPYPVGTNLAGNQLDVLCKYNKKDIRETLKFYYYSIEAIKMRSELTAQFGFDCTNFNDTRIGKELFVQRLEQVKPGTCYKKIMRGGKPARQIQQTKRDKIHLKECLLPYLKFTRPEFEAVRDWFAQQTITETKGVFSDIEEHRLGEVAKYAKMRVKMKKMNCPVDGAKNKRYVPTEEHISEMMKEHPMGWVEMCELKSPKGAASYWFCWNIAETLNVVVNGFQYDYGTGGIHSAENGVFVSDDEYQIFSYDIKSMYPNTSIKNNFYPEHLGISFCTVYNDLYNERASYSKKDPRNGALKLALNGTYGASNDEYSPMYDPKFTMSITVNGQMLLSMLMSDMITELNVKMLMCNTDGFEFIAKKKDKERVEQIVKAWENVTKLEMEGCLYSKMLIRDVNNYLAIKEKE